MKKVKCQCVFCTARRAKNVSKTTMELIDDITKTQYDMVVKMAESNPKLHNQLALYFRGEKPDV